MAERLPPELANDSAFLQTAREMGSLHVQGGRGDVVMNPGRIESDNTFQSSDGRKWTIGSVVIILVEAE